jgi:3-hydroxy-9,10-secoandrosta-1,3,5(10)-triene-9,17-dione monooxygenase
MTNISPPEPNLTPKEMLQRAEAMRPVLRERQAKCEELGRIPEETNQEFVDAGFYRILQPRLFGGYEFDVPDFIRIMSEISRGCPESGWVLALTAGHPAAFIAGYDEKVQCEVYGATGDCRAPGAARPSGVAVPVPGGYKLKGIWDYTSGCDIATHFIGGVMVIDPETKAPGSWGFVLCDQKDVRIVRNWDMIGMQGTGFASHRRGGPVFARGAALAGQRSSVSTLLPAAGPGAVSESSVSGALDQFAVLRTDFGRRGNRSRSVEFV